jgi:two-component system sensor histidine kinase ChvG
VSRIALRLLAFNVLVVFTPVLGILYLDVYESHLRQAQEDAMVQQSRVLAAAIATGDADVPLDAQRIKALLANLGGRTDARLRVYDPAGALVADSAQTAPPARPPATKYGVEPGDTRRRPLYRLGARVANATSAAVDAIRHGLGRGKTQSASDAPPETAVRAAIAGRYGAAIRSTPGQRSLTMFSAIPVRRNGTVIGAVLASQSTFRILRALYDVRLRVFEIVLGSLIVAALLTAIAAGTIVRPLVALERQASRIAINRGRAPERFAGSNRKDELGELARALEALTRRTDDHIALLQSFSADVSHELKNPLASIRTAAEMMATAGSPEERARFLAMMGRDVVRLERLVSSLREIATVERDIALDEIGPVDLRAVCGDVIERARARAGVPIALYDGVPATVRGSPERLGQVFDNLVANAVSFATEGTGIEVRIDGDTGGCRVIVDDRGPGLPESHLERIFDRFFTYRPAEGRGDHVGLGLAIARQIVESYGGSISASNRDGGGARFEVRLPRG